MIVNTGNRTDIPAFYADWFYRRIRAGEVLVRNPYQGTQVTRYRLDPEVVDCLVFCTKNPAPMLPRLEELSRFRQLWYVTVTPYGKDIEPGVPSWEEVCETFRELSGRVGRKRMIWRYDPIFFYGSYDGAFHRERFEQMARRLAGLTDWCVISFVDLYAKTLRNFPGIREVSRKEQEELGAFLQKTGEKYGIRICACCEGIWLSVYGIDCSGCMSQEKIERACGFRLRVPSRPQARKGCDCLLGADLGAYNTCGHGCLYCYANDSPQIVRQNRAGHDPASPLLTGRLRPEDVVKDAVQKSWIDGQMRLF